MPKFFLTTPIYYVNDVPHIGHAYSTLCADAICRWHRLIGDEVFFMTGTDEHGLKVQRAAEANGLTPQEQADNTSVRFREAWELLNISHDCFIRTTEERHHNAVKVLLQKCHDNGFIYKDTYDGLYSVSDEAYVSQEDIDSGKVSGDIEHIAEENYFFRLSAFEEPLKKFYGEMPENVVPSGYMNEVKGILNEGLKDISITRTSLKWGVEVPWDSNHIFYVWYDALVNYATSVGYGADEKNFEEWWPAAHHVVGKDILRFHTIYWPAMLMAAGIKNIPRVLVHGWLLVGGDKMSKSKLNQIAPADMVEDFGVDGFRYCILRDSPFGPDSDFSYEAMESRYQSDLANGLGNLLSRVCTLVETKCGSVSPPPDAGSPLKAAASKAIEEVREAWLNIQPSRALDSTWKIVREANELLTKREPWKYKPGESSEMEKRDAEAALGDSLEALRLAAILLSPTMPETSQKIFKNLGLEGFDPTEPQNLEWGGYQGGLTVKKAEPLFPRRESENN